MNKRILFVTHHRKDRSPGQRFRFEQYFPYLEKNGFECHLSNLLSEFDDRYFHRQGYYAVKALTLAFGTLRRLRDVVLSSRYDIIFVQREAFMLGTSLFEWLYSLSPAKLVFDFDDSIWLSAVSERNRGLSFLKNPDKTSSVISMSDMVFAGNEYLAEYARQFNSNIQIVPTTIDTQEYQPCPTHNPSNQVNIGWSGSFSTIEHFKTAFPALLEIKKKYGDRVRFTVMGDGNYHCPALEIEGIEWNKKNELPVLSTFDIGIMPVPDDAWSRGKCGLKGLQYMALEVATVMSPVGVNREIIESGINGLIADTQEEWVEAISRLIEDTTLREKLSKAGRKTVIDRYSVKSQEPVYLKCLSELVE